MIAIDPDALAEATLIGARRFGHDSGHTYRRRQLTAKQRRLVALLADGDAIGTDDLAKCFPDEWQRILATHPGRDAAQQAEALFENFADVARRINAYLLAGYRDSTLRNKMLTALGSQLLAIVISFADREMWTTCADDLKELTPILAPAQGSRRRAPARVEGSASDIAEEPASPSPGVACQPEPPLATTAPSQPSACPGPVSEPPATVLESSAPRPAGEIAAALLPTSALSPAAVNQGPPPPTTSAPPSSAPATTRSPAPHASESVMATVNPVTLRWTLHFPEGEIEADPRIGTVRSGSRMQWWAAEPLPEDPEALTADQLALLRKMVS